MPSTPGTLAFKVRQKFPGAYDDLDDAALESAVTAKHPGVYDDLPRATLPTKPVSAEDFAPPSRDLSLGNILREGVKSLNPLPAIQAMTADRRPEDALLGPAAALAPLFRGAASGATSEARKAATDVGRGRYSEAAGHAAAAALPLVGPAAAQAGEDIGSGDPGRMERGIGQGLGLTGSIVAPRVLPNVAPPLASIGEQILAKGKALPAAVTKATRGINPIVLDIAGEVAGHAVGAQLGIPTLARRVLAHVLDSAKKPASNAGGRLVKGSALSDEQALANALEELRAPAATQPTVAAPTRPNSPLADPTIPENLGPNASTAPLLERRGVTRATGADADALDAEFRQARIRSAEKFAQTRAKVNNAPPPERVTTPPQASLPPGYTPRTTAPKPKATKPPAALPKALQAEIDKPKRAYFLKPVEELADVADEAVTPTGSLTPDDLPAAWRSHTGQDIFPTTGAEGKELAAALKAELTDRGVSVGEAMARVSNNRAIPTRERAQLLRALNQAYSQR
jgi:hypothetical protein